MRRLGVLFIALLLLLAAAGAGGVLLVRWWRAPATVPDHASGFSATFAARVFETVTIAQHVRPTQNGFTAADFIVVADRPGLPGDVHLDVRVWPAGPVVRTAQMPAAALHTGSVWDFRPGQPAEGWTSFGFPPIADSAGKDYLLVLTYPGGRDADGQRVATLAHFPRTYRLGDIRVNGEDRAGTLLFRLASAGTHGEAVRGAVRTLAQAQPVLTGSELAPAILGGVCIVFAAGLVWAILHVSTAAAVVERSERA